MRITFDSEVDALYIGFIETTVTAVPVAEDIAVDYAADGRIAGIETSDAPQRFGDPGVFRRVALALPVGIQEPSGARLPEGVEP
ncbi:MAG: DUF2283 domain-containing protein [Anaerolineae bacterium]|nr:DUF2283 domain-containing protein [Anaerolineae bacterium]